eukprot:4384528-Karenia_brevis.AAC.1
MPQLHPCFDHLGMANLSHASEADERIDASPKRSHAWESELIVEGRVVIYTDGACRRNQCARLRRAGVGAFWAVRHSMNVSVPLEGPVQTNQRAELQALVLVLDREARSMEVRSDSAYVVNGFHDKLPHWRGLGWLEIENGDLWEIVDKHVCQRPPGSVLLTKVVGHASWRDVRTGQVQQTDKIGNDMADELACLGADQHAIDQQMINHSRNSYELTRSVQHMMVDIIVARSTHGGVDFSSASDTADSSSEEDDTAESSSMEDEVISISSDSDSAEDSDCVCLGEVQRPLFHAVGWRGRGPLFPD